MPSREDYEDSRAEAAEYHRHELREPLTPAESRHADGLAANDWHDREGVTR